ncbi:MAG: acyl-CoA reductase [Limisphaerales bacterium]
MVAFDPLIVDFLDAVSGSILKLPSVKESPELVALAFWLRKANIRGIVDGFRKSVGAHELTTPWGVALHIAPSNVDTLFVYSWALAMLAGNINIIRISQNVGSQLEVLLGMLQKLMSDPHWRSIAERNVVMTYPRDERTSNFISRRADIRVIWGGDETVRSLRSLPAKPRTKDISFPDKVSSTVVQAGRYLKCGGDTLAAIAKSFYNDAYQFDQLACSSPHFVFFVGPEADCAEASQQFWSRLTQELERRQHDEHASTATDKFVAACDLLARQEGSRWIWGLRSPLPLVLRVPLASIPDCRDRIGGGFFLECFIGELAALSEVVQQGDQTLGYAGFTRDEMRAVAETLCLRGIDRIVPVGQALTFGPVWDGYVLLSELTRRISVA